MVILKHHGVGGSGGTGRFLLGGVGDGVEFLHVECKIVAELPVTCAGFLDWAPFNVIIGLLGEFAMDANRASNGGHGILCEC